MGDDVRRKETEWRETEVEDERFLPLIEAAATEILENLWLGSEANVRDLIFLKVQGITKILTINSFPVNPIDTPHASEALKSYFAEHVTQKYIECLDTPIELVYVLLETS